MLCWVFGQCFEGDKLGREVGDLKNVEEAVGSNELFTYVRYNAELMFEGLKKLVLPGIKPEHVQQMDSVEHILELQQVGQAVAKSVKIEHFERFV